MLKHTLLMLYRTFVRFKMTFFINLVGLSSGLIGVGLIYLWVNDEVQVDKYHEKGKRLYQVLTNDGRAGDITTAEVTPGPLAQYLEDELPEVEYSAAVVPSQWFPYKGIIAFGQDRMKAEVQFASGHFFDVFTFPLIQGDKKGALTDKNAMVITESLAIRLFHTTENVVGKTVDWKHEPFNGSFYISAICQTPPAGASMHFDVMLNYDLFVDKRPWMKDWGNSDPYTYVVLKPNTDPAGVKEKITNVKRVKTNDPNQGTFTIQPYEDRYLYNRYENGKPAGGRVEYVELFSVIAVFILIIACINFMNLSTAKASRRVKEVGIKKAIGAGRHILITQYFAESLAMTLLSLLIALLAIDLLLPAFNTFTGKQLALHFDTSLLLGTSALFVITGLIAGSYPALYLSGFNPAAVLKGKLAISWGEVWARRGLVIFQFTLSIILIVSVIVVYRQMNYIQTKNLGYSRDQVLYFDMEMPTDWDHEPSFLIEVRNIPGVLNASCFYHDLMGHHGGTSDVQWDGQGTNQVGFSSLDVGLDFIQTLGIQMAEGQSFTRDIPATNQIIFNEKAIRSMGLKDPVGKKITLWGEEKQIVGVARDFHFASLYEQVGPCFITVHPALPNVIVKIAAGKEQETIAALGKVHQVYSPGIPIDFKFIDEKYQTLYAAEHRVSILSQYFAGVAILISCLGLFGLAAFTAERRTKEIGIRKILGSSNLNIIMLLSGDFTKMVLIAILIALPISYLIVQNWLQQFEYRTDMELWYFAVSGIVALAIAWATVGMQTLKAARVNPTKTLKEQ